jgi:hypothetical protein
LASQAQDIASQVVALYREEVQRLAKAGPNVVACDYDGTILNQPGHLTDPKEIEAGPVPGAFNFLHTLLENNWKVVIFSTRLTNDDDGSTESVIRSWFPGGRPSCGRIGTARIHRG